MPLLRQLLQAYSILHTAVGPGVLSPRGVHQASFLFNKVSFQHCVVQEWVPGGELFHHLDIEGSFSDAAACFYAANVLLALECLHAREIVYRDLKPENLLLDTKVCCVLGRTRQLVLTPAVKSVPCQACECQRSTASASQRSWSKAHSNESGF